MRIDQVYIGCCRLDYYLTRICVASIRYWNNDIPITLIKDRSKGDFDTAEMEEVFHVSIAPLQEANMRGYSKLYPYMNLKAKRIFLMDSDIVWLGNITDTLEQYNEDIILQGYSPKDYINEVNKWYFNTDKLLQYYKEYTYPGFLFNAGQIIFNTDIFSADDFKGIIEWKDRLEPVVDNVFLCEDQGILNYIVSKKLKAGQISIKNMPLYVGGWSPEAMQFGVKDIIQKKSTPLLIHWFGEKKGLVSALPNNSTLKFYEKYYYSKLTNGAVRLLLTRLTRSVKHLDVLLYHCGKMVYYKLVRPLIR